MRRADTAQGSRNKQSAHWGMRNKESFFRKRCREIGFTQEGEKCTEHDRPSQKGSGIYGGFSRRER